MKKKVLLLVGLVLCLLLVGCGKSSSEEAKKPKDVIPDPNEYFSESNITLLRNDDKGVYYMVEKYSEDDFIKYLDACTSGVFTNTTYSKNDDDGAIYYINSSDENYRLEYTSNKEKRTINIICYNKTDEQ